MNLLINLSTIIIALGLFSCQRVNNKAKETVNSITEHSQGIIESYIPNFDYDSSDTDNNKNRFNDFVKVKITADVKNIYCFDDAIGIDTDYMFSFNCNTTTSNLIIKTHNLVIDTIDTNNGFGIQDDFHWWNKERIAELQKYSWTDGKHYFKYYWYDSENMKAYFFDFDM